MKHTRSRLALSLVVTFVISMIIMVSPTVGFRQDAININMQPQERHSDDTPPYGWGCGAACLQANVDWIMGHWYEQDEFWGFIRDRNCREWGGNDPILPLTSAHPSYGDHGKDVRKLNIAYDFGADPHAVAWAMWYYAGGSYHNYIYDGLWIATQNLLWTLEHYQEPVMAAVHEGSHWISVTGYEANAAATDLGFSVVYQIRYSDPWPTNPRDNWVGYNDWEDLFTRYTNVNDPDPAVGGYVPPPNHWYNRWATIERDTINRYSPDWAMTIDQEGVTSPIPHHWRIYAPTILNNHG